MTKRGPKLVASDYLHSKKYRAEGESFEAAMQRVATALADHKQHDKALFDILANQRFLPAGRVQAAMGSPRNITAYNCFVSGTIEDSFVDGDGSIMQRVTEAAATMRMGGGIGFNFGTLRNEGALIKRLGSRSSGPISFMKIYNETCLCTASTDDRRGAMMGVMPVSHPDIFKFIEAKHNDTQLTGMNLSIAITDDFMRAVENDDYFDLSFNGVVVRRVQALELWEAIMRSTYEWAEPGVLFIDTINRMNNLSYCEDIRATNPCGEQPLPPFGACLLGSFNLVKYIVPFRNALVFDSALFQQDIFDVVRGMDNVVDRTTYPLMAQEKEAKSKRRMGLGVTGLSNAIEAIIGGPAYGDDEFVSVQRWILERLRDNAYRASIELAKEKGAFPMYNRSYLDSAFLKNLPDDIFAKLSLNGIRNSHLTSIAPTGTISTCADNVSSGLEPVFAYSTERKIRSQAGERIETLPDYGIDNFGIQGKRSSDVTIKEHLAVLEATVPYIDSAVSKTCNVPSDIAYEDFKTVYMQAWKQGNKGCTTYRMGGAREGILKSADHKDVDPVACMINPDGSRSCE